MKITFFKNESHFYPRISYTYENADTVKKKIKTDELYLIIYFLTSALLMIYAISNYKVLIENLLLLFFLLFWILPIHEFCHCLGCWLGGKKVDRVCFFPYKWSLGLDIKPSAYVRPVFDVWTKKQRLIFVLAPFVILTVTPLVISLFAGDFDKWLVYVALYNWVVSCIDISNALGIVFLPKGTFIIDGFPAKQENNSLPVVIHRIYITNELNQICHEQYSYLHGILVKIDDPLETQNVKNIKSDFFKQFDL